MACAFSPGSGGAPPPPTTEPPPRRSRVPFELPSADAVGLWDFYCRPQHPAGPEGARALQAAGRPLLAKLPPPSDPHEEHEEEEEEAAARAGGPALFDEYVRGPAVAAGGQGGGRDELRR